MYCIEISARIIRWPHVCACCCQTANSTIQISSTRVTGKKVIRTQTKSWDIPFCRQCLAHVKASAELETFSMFVFHGSVSIGLIGAGVTLLFFAMFYQTAWLGTALCLLSAAMTVGILIATYSYYQEKYERANRFKRQKQLELTDHLDSLMSDTCATEGQLAASYEGWYGTIHTFYFSSREFASRIEQINRGKCLHRGRVHHGEHDKA